MRFLKTLTGQIVLLLILAGFVGYLVFSRYQKNVAAAAVPPPPAATRMVNPLAETPEQPPKPNPGSPTAQHTPSRSVPMVVGSQITRLVVPDTPEQSGPTPPPEIPKEVRAQMLAQPEPLTLFTSPPKEAPPPPRVSNEYAPYGRLVRCKLVTGLESSNLSSPLIAITIEDVVNRGEDGTPHVIIPAGIEVHGPVAALGRVRDRIEVRGQWVFVWRTSDENNGRELPVQGIACTRETDRDTGDIMPGDAAGGIHGDLLEPSDSETVKLFAAAFLKNMASGMSQTQSNTNVFTNERTTQLTPGLRNAAIGGVQADLDELANRIRKQIDTDGFYVAVPAGREFYVYVPQTIDLRNARRGALVQAPSQTPNHAPATP